MSDSLVAAGEEPREYLTDAERSLWRKRSAIVQTARERWPELISEERGKLFLEFLERKSTGLPLSKWLDDNNLPTTFFLDIPVGAAGYKLEAVAQKMRRINRILRAEDALIHRGVVGTKKGVYHKGQRVATEKRYSDTCLSVLLKAEDPDKYADRQKVEHSGAMIHLNIPALRGQDEPCEPSRPVIEVVEEPPEEIVVPKASQKVEPPREPEPPPFCGPPRLPPDLSMPKGPDTEPLTYAVRKVLGLRR
jgi:hypothetical protein